MDAVILLLRVALYCAALVIFTLYIAPFVVIVSAVYATGLLLACYFKVFAKVLLKRDTRFPGYLAYPPDQENGPARRQYFFGPAMRDQSLLARDSFRAGVSKCRDVIGKQREKWFTVSEKFYYTIPVGIAIGLGLVVGAGLGAVFAAVLGLVQAVAAVTAQVLARVLIGALRIADTALLIARGTRGMLCPTCYQRMGYPVYACPNPECRARHKDVRPGRYGVLRRRCTCGTRIPTLLLLGSHRLAAYCTDANCGKSMSDAVGRSKELIVPLFGGRSAGKTQLMSTMMMSMAEEMTKNGTPFRTADKFTTDKFETQSTVLQSGRYISSTPLEELPHAHSMHLGKGRSRRLIHIFDAAGERFLDTDRVDELEFARYARTFVFVLDPMAVREFKDGLSVSERESLDLSSASDAPPEQVFHHAVGTLTQMEVPLNRCRLIVAISKADMYEGSELYRGREKGSAGAARWLTEDPLLQGNLVRAMQHEFGEVKFLFTAAVLDGDGRVHESIRAFNAAAFGRRKPWLVRAPRKAALKILYTDSGLRRFGRRRNLAPRRRMVQEEQ